MARALLTKISVTRMAATSMNMRCLVGERSMVRPPMCTGAKRGSSMPRNSCELPRWCAMSIWRELSAGAGAWPCSCAMARTGHAARPRSSARFTIVRPSRVITDLPASVPERPWLPRPRGAPRGLPPSPPAWLRHGGRGPATPPAPRSPRPSASPACQAPRSPETARSRCSEWPTSLEAFAVAAPPRCPTRRPPDRLPGPAPSARTLLPLLRQRPPDRGRRASFPATVLLVELPDQRVERARKPQQDHEDRDDAAIAELLVQPAAGEDTHQDGDGELNAQPGIAHRSRLLAATGIRGCHGRQSYLLVKFVASSGMNQFEPLKRRGRDGNAEGWRDGKTCGPNQAGRGHTGRQAWLSSRSFRPSVFPSFRPSTNLH